MNGLQTSQQLIQEDKFYRAYMEFFEIAERKRRWNLFDDVPWDRLSAVTNSEERAIQNRNLLRRGDVSP